MATNKNRQTAPTVVPVQRHSASHASTHPRRPLAKDSVSLPQGLSAPDSSQPGSVQISNSSSLIAQRDSSGETSNADNWFDRSNKNTNSKPTFDDSDSPFNFDHDDSPMRPQGQRLLNGRHPLIRGNSTGSSNEEYRSVIDDLTIENKRLKKKLKRLERAHDSTLQKEKSFEVRVHGLPPEKKRELEETLRKFASNLNQAPARKTFSSSALSGLTRSGNTTHKPDSSLSSVAPQIADSGYGSLTATGKTSTPQSAAIGSKLNSTNPTNVSSQSIDKSIRSYLHDIPEGLMPRHPTVMTEKSKEKIVVRRLEQIFGGKVADPALGQQPLQQQEVSKTAARDDRSAMEATGRKAIPEGHREAPIMETETEDPLPANNPPKPRDEADRSGEAPGKDPSDLKQFDSNPNSATSAITPILSSEQRPTRPLDLDPHRAQDPNENLEYFRHLGFFDDPSEPGIDGQNWIYLNLLINMAQLHTINVTNDFVKDAISKHSNKLELSDDGRKVRWRDNSSPLSQSSSMNETDSDSSPALQGGNAGDKRTRPTHFEDETSRQFKKQVVAGKSQDKFAYRPIIPSNKVSSGSDESDDESMADAEWTPSQIGEGVTGSGFGSSAKRPVSLPVRKEAGPIIFYNNATFCTDLSGDTTLANRMQKYTGSQAITGSPLGAATELCNSPRYFGSSSIKGSTKGSTRGSVMGSARVSRKGSGIFDVSEMTSSIDSLSPDDSATLKFPSKEVSPKHVTFAEPEEPMPLEASGIGGITPHDNIAITVHRQYSSSSEARRKGSAPVNSKLSAVLPSSKRPGGTPYRERIISTYEKNLEPSPLPPASLHFDVDDAKSESDSLDVETSESGDSDDWDTQDGGTEEPMVPVTLGVRAPFSSSGSEHSDSEASESEEEEDNADSQMDFLAAARAADPEAIRAREREYDAEMAERLAEEIPAGSSAATAGGGSGFNSPEVDMLVGKQQ